MGSEFDLISRDAQTALTEFSQDFAMALSQPGVEAWAKAMGLYRSSAALKTTYPIPISAAGYAEFKGDVKYRALGEKSIELKPKTWQDGVEELASVIEAPDFIGWTTEPAAMAAAAMSLHNEIVAALLKANAVQPLDGIAYFGAGHPFNVLNVATGTFDNDISGAVSIAGLKAAKAHFRKLKAPNGKPLGLRMTHWAVRPDDEETARDLLEQDILIQSLDAGTTFGAVDNRHKGSVQLVVMEEHDDGANNYAFALNKPGMRPWICQDQGMPETIVQDKTSGKYAEHLTVSFASILRGNAGLALPQCALRLDGSD